MQIREHKAFDTLLDTIVQLPLSLFSGEETVSKQNVIEDVEENVPEKEVDADFLPNMVSKVFF